MEVPATSIPVEQRDFSVTAILKRCHPCVIGQLFLFFCYFRIFERNVLRRVVGVILGNLFKIRFFCGLGGCISHENHSTHKYFFYYF